jgi:2-polyprenyl-3-methyl-5-hydroxy-6-metoxy-1,4-benzoquinol methylase
VRTWDDAVAALASDDHWNHNTHYHRLIPRLTPPPYRRVLDVGCGEGLLTRRLAPLAEHVTGIDLSAPMVERARALADADNLTYRSGDLLTTELDGPFDLVTAFAVLHHLDLVAGLRRLKDLTAPGGTLLVVGLARPQTPGAVVASAAGVLANRWVHRRRGSWDPGAPILDTRTTDRQVRAAAREVLPGASVRSRLYWRYSLVWGAPSSG